MRWPALYARSRQLAVPVSALVLGAALLLGLSRWLWDGRMGILSMIIVMTLGVAAASPGLAGFDHDLDRTASFSWPLRRATHLIGLGVVTTGLSLAVNATLDSGLPTGVVLRDVAGQVGLLGLGVALIGGSFGWCPPFVFMVLAQVARATGRHGFGDAHRGRRGHRRTAELSDVRPSSHLGVIRVTIC
jgi:hypothetical protein